MVAAAGWVWGRAARELSRLLQDLPHGCRQVRLIASEDCNSLVQRVGGFDKANLLHRFASRLLGPVSSRGSWDTVFFANFL